MELNTILIWTVAVSCGVMALQACFLRVHLGHIVLPLSILALLGALFLWDPDTAGLISGLVWVLFLMLPQFLHGMLNRALAKKQYRLSRLLAYILRLLQPFDGNTQLPRLMLAIQWLNSGKGDAAQAILEEIRQSSGSVGRLALGLYTRLTGNWNEFLERVSYQMESGKSPRDPLLLETYLQSLGETNRRQELFQKYQALVANRLGSIPPILVTINEMKVAAFAGDDLLVAQLQNLLGDSYPDDQKQFWMATARQVAGATQVAEDSLRQLAREANFAIASAAERRLASPLPTLFDSPLSLEEEAILAGIRRRAGAVVLDQAFRNAHAPWATRLLLAVMIAVFLLELPGGSEDYNNLIGLGALQVPLELNNGEWWRPLTAAFLHFGVIHLGMNALGLAVLGPLLERLWGGWRVGLTFLLAAVGGIALAPVLMEPVPDGTATILLGASGGVMGLIGGLCLQAGVMFWKGRTQPLMTQFLLLISIIILQIFFDSMTPNISGEAHLLGLGIGMTCALLWNLTKIPGQFFNKRSFNKKSVSPPSE